MVLKKKENENDFEYGLRLIESKCEKTLDLDWQDIVEILKLDCHRDSLRKACSVTEFSSYNVMKYFQEKIKDMLESNSGKEGIENLIKELQEKTLELEKEKVRFQDQKREYKNYLRADARFEHLRDEMILEINKLGKLEPFSSHIQTSDEEGTELVAICSDWHIGLKEENYWNKVDIEIMKNRVSKYTNKIIEISKRHNSKVLHLELLGDMLNGIIHVTTRISNEEDIISQAMICSEILSNMIHQLSGYFEKINIYSASGNHGRVSANAKESIDTENFENLIPWYLEARLKNLSNVEIIANKYDSEIIVYKFLNETMFAVHGHNDRLTSAVDNLSKMLKVFPTIVTMGHFHHFYENDEYDIPVVVNGTASGVDKYTKKIRKFSSPMQVCMVFNKMGRECTYKIKL